MQVDPKYILQIRGLTKKFSGVKALEDVSLNVRRGEVHALMGENGAGKSTLMKILIGLISPDAGQILFEGESLATGNVQEIRRKGISMIHQEMLTVPELTVAQNLFLGREKKRGWLGWLDDRALEKEADLLLAQLGLELDSGQKMKYLSVAQMQMVEIAKAIHDEAKVIIMDEPTSAITDKEVTTLFGIIGELKQKGVAIIYISHKMDEIFAISDVITVLRDGNYIGTFDAQELNAETLIRMMVGRELTNLFPTSTVVPGEIVLSVRNLYRSGKFSSISFDVRAGEVLGIAGLMGAGRTEIASAIFGLDPLDEGKITVSGKNVSVQSPTEALQLGIGYVSEDRKVLGLVGEMTVQENLTLSSLRNHRKNGLIDTQSESAAASQIIKELKIKTAGADQKVKNLSGGNQQKVVLGKVLLCSPNVILLDEPTRGIDVGAKAEIYQLINQLAANGIAIVLISSELPELIGLCNRILVIAKGKQTALLDRKEISQESIMHYAMQI